MSAVTRRDVCVGHIDVGTCRIEIGVDIEARANIGVDIGVHIPDAHEHEQVLDDKDNTRRNGASPKELHRSVERGEPVG